MNEVLRQYLEQKLKSEGLSYERASELSGVPATTIYRILLGKNNPDTETQGKLCRWLGISPSIEFGDVVKYVPPKPMQEMFEEIIGRDANLTDEVKQHLTGLMKEAYFAELQNAQSQENQNAN